MDLSEIPTRQLLEALKTRVDTLLVLGIVVENDKTLTFHRYVEGFNLWSLKMPLSAEIRRLDHLFDNAWDEPEGSPNSVIEF